MGFALGFDVAAALLLAGMAARGFYRGFVGEIFSIAGLSCGVFFSWQYSRHVMGVILEYFPKLDAALANIIAMALIFFVIALFFALLSKIIRAFIRFADLSFFNHIAGLIIGILTGLVILLFVYGGLTIFAPALGANWIEDSIIMNLMAKMWPPFQQFLINQGWIDTTKLLPQT